jgi:hypothetical protein
MNFPQRSLGVGPVSLDPQMRITLLENQVGLLQQELKLLKDVCRALCGNDIQNAIALDAVVRSLDEPPPDWLWLLPRERFCTEAPVAIGQGPPGPDCFIEIRVG